MKSGIYIGIGIALIAAAILLQLLPDADTGSTPAQQGTEISATAAPVESTVPATPTSDTSQEQATNDPERDAGESFLAGRREEMTEAIYQAGGDLFINQLMNSGLARADSERIARQYAEDMTACAEAAMTLEAESQSLTLQELLTNLQETVQNSDLNSSDMSEEDIRLLTAEAIDQDRVEENMFPCAMAALQRTGLSIRE
jgi:hypothetical protein